MSYPPTGLPEDFLKHIGQAASTVPQQDLSIHSGEPQILSNLTDFIASVYRIWFVSAFTHQRHDSVAMDN